MVGVLDALQLTDIYTSPITLTLWGLFFLNLTLVMWQRLPLIRSRIALSTSKIIDPATAGSFPFRQTIPLPEGVESSAPLRFLKSKGYAIVEEGPLFYGVRNRLSPIAFGLFHISFFLILIGGLISVYTEFYGYIDLAEGETFQGEMERYSAIPAPPSFPKIGSPPKVSFTVAKIEPQVSGMTETGLKVTLVDARQRKHVIDINRPYIDDSTTFVLKTLGMAPLVVLKDRDGKEIDGAYERLDCLKGRRDQFAMGGFEFKAKFYPDYVLEQGKAATRSLEFNNPVFLLTVEQDKKKIAEGTIAPGGQFEFGGYRLEMRELRYWVRFNVVKEQGIPILYAGFALASLSIVWRLLFFRREIVGAVRGDGVELRLEVAARSEYYKSLADEEFTKLFADLTAEIGRTT
jgi:cytochrome c biogenesis protein ResB